MQIKACLQFLLENVWNMGLIGKLVKYFKMTVSHVLSIFIPHNRLKRWLARCSRPVQKAAYLVFSLEGKFSSVRHITLLRYIWTVYDYINFQTILLLRLFLHLKYIYLFTDFLKNSDVFFRCLQQKFERN